VVGELHLHEAGFKKKPVRRRKVLKRISHYGSSLVEREKWERRTGGEKLVDYHQYGLGEGGGRVDPTGERSLRGLKKASGRRPGAYNGGKRKRPMAGGRTSGDRYQYWKGNRSLERCRIRLMVI